MKFTELFLVRKLPGLFSKAFFFFILGLPLISGWPISALSNSQILEPLSNGQSLTILWAIYSILILAIVIINFGRKKGLQIFGVGLFLGSSTAIFGTLARLILPALASGQSTSETIEKMVRLFFTILSVVPFSLLFVNGFSPKLLVEKSLKLKGRFRILGFHFALTLRVFQHVGETVFKLYDYWLEENPEVFYPRHRPFQSFVTSPVFLFRWLYSSISAWMYACIMHSFEPLPVMVEEIELLEKVENPNQVSIKRNWDFTATAMVAALTGLATLSTLLIKIPIPVTGGYFNIGDIFVILAGIWLGPIPGLLVGAFGPAIADAIGYPVYIPATFIIKGFEGYIAGAISGGSNSKNVYRKILGAIVGSFFMVLGYFLFEAYFYPELGKYIPAFAITDIGAAFAALLPNAVQGFVGGIGGFILWKALTGISNPGKDSSLILLESTNGQN